MAHFIPLFPFLAFIINIFFGRKLKEGSARVSIFSSVISLVLSVQTFISYQSGSGSYSLGEWLSIHGVPLTFGVTVDSLTVMMLLVDNFVLLYIFWEGVGLCSYILIAFWFERPAAAKAGLKAFVTTRIGDTG